MTTPHPLRQVKGHGSFLPFRDHQLTHPKVETTNSSKCVFQARGSALEKRTPNAQADSWKVACGDTGILSWPLWHRPVWPGLTPVDVGLHADSTHDTRGLLSPLPQGL